MSDKDDVLGAAVLKELCPICAKEVNSSILINRKLTKSEAKKVNDLHGGNVWSKEWCDECKKLKELGGVILIGAVEAKTTDVTNPYRSGNIWVVKDEAASIITAGQPIPESRVMFVDVNVAAQVGLPDVNLNA
jgi:hypothetical protein